ncbi:uncharacterized protein DUF2529 [Cytobacillus horneckiae]|uniref:DUF2529 domain-containing protein n=1 Tax=Cytobacillus horneckiae TaxID=549687 RepID=A0A2N0ZFZ6_9BACI|nr:DUF2529 domain-containing protein [Cytobacillus horneckiae]MBN6885016.1 DUF2529 domain-containing protein [Cytobacillus horneckiae]MEC1154459.1 DUF2529 domain-containing protein [Cytobacillus horneckiae]MED2937794.1 DUF2529 domain-containing protein [Cytobacillus horneckiae]PKG28440.1 DUF2529 domain-containing protein [Cytobacillus horneckiae]
MLKMFSTQVFGLFKRLNENKEEAIEDIARILAQASVGDGKIYIFGTEEMMAVGLEATVGQEPLPSTEIWHAGTEFNVITDTDRFLIITRESNHQEALRLAKYLSDRFIPFATISAKAVEGEEQLVDYSDVHIDLQLKKGLLPDDAGNRFGYPSSMAALFVYYGIKFTIDEMLDEY